MANEPKVLETGNSNQTETTYQSGGTSEATEVNAPKVLSSQSSEQSGSVNAGQSVANAYSNGEARELLRSEDSLQTERGESGSSEAVVGTTARESTQSESVNQNINQTDVKAIVDDTKRFLKVSTDNQGTTYVHVVSANEGFERSTGDKKVITNTILVNEVKKLIRELGGSGGGSDDTYTKAQIDAFLNGKENISNKVLAISNTSTDTQYPSAKCVYDNLVNVREVAEGKCKAFVINEQSDITGTKDANDNYTGVTAITNVDLSLLKIGDIILIKELNVPDYWVSALVYEDEVLTSISLDKMETSKVDLTNYVDLNSIQSITAIKNFLAGIGFGTNAKIYKDSNDRLVFTFHNEDRMKIGSANILFKARLDPDSDGTYNIGRNSVRWKDLHLSHAINPNSSNYGLTFPDTSGFTADKELGLAEGTLNVINAAEIVNNTLTQAQYDLITNGKPTLILGTILGYTNPLIVSLEDFTTTLRGFMFAGRTLRGIMINVSLRTLSDSGNDLCFDKVNKINGKIIPNYPSNTGTFVLKCVDGTLTWVQE